MLPYCLKCRKKQIVKTQGSWSKYVVCDGKKLRLIKEQEISGILSGLLGLKSPFEGIP